MVLAVRDNLDIIIKSGEMSKKTRSFFIFAASAYMYSCIPYCFEWLAVLVQYVQLYMHMWMSTIQYTLVQYSCLPKQQIKTERQSFSTKENDAFKLTG